MVLKTEKSRVFETAVISFNRFHYHRQTRIQAYVLNQLFRMLKLLHLSRPNEIFSKSKNYSCLQ